MAIRGRSPSWMAVISSAHTLNAASGPCGVECRSKSPKEPYKSSCKGAIISTRVFCLWYLVFFWHPIYSRWLAVRPTDTPTRAVPFGPPIGLLLHGLWMARRRITGRQQDRDAQAARRSPYPLVWGWGIKTHTYFGTG